MFGVRMRSIREQIYRSESIGGNVNTCFRAADESFSSHSNFNLDSLNITRTITASSYLPPKLRIS